MAGGNKNLLVSLVVRARDEASGVLGKMSTKIAGIAAAIAAVFSIRAVSNFFQGAIAQAATFEEQMSVVQAVTRASAEELKQLEQAASEMGASTRYTATEAAGALESLARAGLSASESITALPEVLALAQGNAIGLESAASLVTQAIRGMGLEISEARRVADAFTATAASANTTVEALGIGLSYVAPVAKSAGLSLEQTTALLGKLADAGIDASRGGTSLVNVLSQLRDPASRFRVELRALGINTTNFIEVLRGLENAGPRAEAALNAVGLRAGPAMEALLGQGVASVEELTERVLGMGGAAQEAAGIMDDNLAGAMRGLRSIWESLSNTLVKPLLGPIADQVRDLTAKLRELRDSGVIHAFGRTLKDAFDRATSALREFVGELDISKAAQTAIDWVGRLGTSFNAVAASVRTIAGAIQVIWNTVYGGVAVVGHVIARIAQEIVRSLAGAAHALSRLGLVSQATVDELVIMQGALGASAKAMLDEVGAAWEGMQRGAQRVLGTYGDVEQQSEGLKVTLADVAAATESTARRMQDAADRARYLTDAVDEQKETIRELDAAYKEALAAFREGNGTWEAVVEAMHEVDAARRALAEGLSADAGEVAAAFQLLGIESTEALTNVARAARQAFETIKQGETTIDDQRRAWLAWAKTALESGDSVQVSMAETEARVMGLTDEYAELRRETLGVAEGNVELADSMQRLAESYAQAEREATRETRALVASRRQREDAARLALEAAEARGFENEAKIKAIELAEAEVATAEAVAAAKAAEAQAAWDHVQALYQEAAADGVLTAAENQVIAKAREVAQVKEQEARAHAQAADAKRQEAQAAQDATSQAVSWAQVVEHARKRYEALSEEAVAFFNKTMSTVRTIDKFFEYTSRSFFLEIEKGFRQMNDRAEELTESLGRAEITTGDLAIAQAFLNNQWRLSQQTLVALGDEQLGPLRRALADAQRRMAALEEDATDTLASLQDELLGLQGAEDEIARRRLERRRAEIEAKLAEARAARNNEAVRDLQEALKILEKIGREEERQHEQAVDADRREGRRDSDRARGQAPGPPPRTVKMEISVGGQAGTVEVMEGDDATLERLLRSLEVGKGRVQ